MLLGWKHTMDNRPYKLGLTYKYNKYTLERARVGSAPTITARPSKAFSQLEITNYRGLDQPP